MPGYAWPCPSKITSSICSFNRYVPDIYTWYIPLRYQSLKILQSDWPRAFLCLTQEADFSQTYSFNRIIKVIVVHDLNPKTLTFNGLFFCKTQKTYFWGVFGQYPKNLAVNFLPLRHPNFMRSFRKILWAILEKTRLPTDVLTYWHWWNHRTIGSPINEVSNATEIVIIFLFYVIYFLLAHFYFAK